MEMTEPAWFENRLNELVKLKVLSKRDDELQLTSDAYARIFALAYTFAEEDESLTPKRVFENACIYHYVERKGKATTEEIREALSILMVFLREHVEKLESEVVNDAL